MLSDVTACPYCRVPIAKSAARCRACGTRLLSPSQPAAPPIWITTEGYRALDLLIRRHHRPGDDIARFLLGELQRAVICAPEWIRADVVTLNSRVTFAIDGTEPQTCVLVDPAHYTPTGHHVSVLTPLGAALIGLAAGSRMAFTDRQGTPATVRVEAVPFQPEAARRAAPDRDPPPAA
jgi:regulator of nucleoside diphosphate kinase